MKLKASSGVWILLGVIICIIIIVLALFLIVFPKKNKVGEAQTQIDDIEMRINTERNRLSQLKQYEKDPEQFLRQIDVLEERIPSNVELADIMQEIDYAAEEAGLDFVSFTPDFPVTSQSLYAVTSEVNMRGRYFNLIEFFNHIERLPRSVKVVSLSVAASDEGLPYLTIRIVFRSFFTTEQGIEKLVKSAG
jgi:Tfp pilus assembly protein PilO